MTSLFSFAPDPQRGVRVDDAMHLALADSLAHLAEAVGGVDPTISTRIATIGHSIQGGARVPALSFALYYQLALALMQNDLGQANMLTTRIEAQKTRLPGQPVRVTGQPDTAELVDQLRQEADPLLHFSAVPDTTAIEFTALLTEGRALMGRHLPALKGEIDAIVHEILLGHAPVGAKVEFDGASHYQYWGLLMLNPKHHRTPQAVVEVLAHEAAHSLLFGLTIDEPLVLNPDEETFTSPLRPDPRPMDGIYHATFVSARMALAMEVMADVAELSPQDRVTAADAARKDRENFAAGMAIVREHGLLTDSGKQIIAAAEAWISG